MSNNIPITRNTLPPRLQPTLATRQAASPGSPSPDMPGVYNSHPPSQQQAPQLVQQASAGADGTPMHGQEAEAGWGNGYGSHSGMGAGVPGASLRGSLPPVDYNYPELGHTAIMATRGPLPGQPSARSPAYDVYGQPRAVPAPLPRTYRANEAAAALNERHIEAEGSMLKVPGGKTCSGSLLRAAGKVARQFSLSPSHIHFGNVPLGTVEHRTARLHNRSIGPARFSVDRPTLPLRTIYKPGPVPAGMEAVITVEFVADRLGDFVGEVVVRSELNVLAMSVSAKVVEASSSYGKAGPAAIETGVALAPVASLDPDKTLSEVLAEGAQDEGDVHLEGGQA